MAYTKNAPDGDYLKKWLRGRDIKRRIAAELTETSQRQFDRYCLPLRSKATRIPLDKWLKLRDAAAQQK